MKKLIFLVSLFIFGSLPFFAQSVAIVKPAVKAETFEREKFDPTRNAAADLQTAILKAKKENKRIVLDVGGEWCGWCIHMDKFFAAHADLTKLRDANYVWVKVNMSEENENKEFLAQYPAAAGYPHLYVLEKDGKLIQSQNTSALEEGKTYNLQVFTDFLKKYAPTKNAAR
jgi:thiol:disulfide interchange protein